MSSTTAWKHEKMEFLVPSEASIKYVSMILGISIASITLWRKLDLTPKVICLWNKTLGKPAHQIGLILDQLQSDDGTPVGARLTRMEHEIQLARVDQAVDFMARKEALFQTDSEGNCIGANTAYLRLIGRTFSEIEGKGWVSIFPQEERAAIMDEWNDAILDERDFDMELPIRNTNGEIIMTHAHAFRKLSFDGEVLGYMGRLETV